MVVGSIKKYLVSLLLVLATGTLCGFQESNPEIDQKLIDRIEINTFIVSRDQLADIL